MKFKPSNRQRVLLGALRADDATTFRAILEQQGWPQNSEWSDYEMLLKAVKLGRKRVTCVLLEKGARVFKKPRVNSPLHEAATQHGWTNIIEVLLLRGAQVIDVNSKGETALHVAFGSQQATELVDLLLDAHVRDARDDVVSREGLSFLHIACTRPDLEIVKALLDGGFVDVGLQVPVISSSVYAGYTPLHFAVEFGQYDVADFLLGRYNANVREQDANGSTPLHLALERRDVKMIDIILQYDENHEDCYNKFGLSHFMAVCAGSDEGLVEEYLRVADFRSWTDSDTLVNSQVDNHNYYSHAGYTPLHFAAEYGRVETAKLLLQLGARCCSTTTVHRVTPLGLARQQSHAQVCRLFGECCTDVFEEPPAKRRRTDGCEQSTLVGRSEGLGKRKVSLASIDSDSTSIFSSDERAFSVQPFMLWLNPRQVYEENDSAISNCFLTHSNPKLYCTSPDHSVTYQGVWQFGNQTDTAIDYHSIEVPQDLESSFYEPLNDIDLDDSLYALEPDRGYLSDDDIDANIESSSVNVVDEQLKFDELFEKFIRDKKLAESDSDDVDSSFSSYCDQTEKLSSSDCSYASDDDLDTTSEISSLSSEPDFVQKASYISGISQGSSTVILSSDCEWQASVENAKNLEADNDSSRCLLFERDVEITFVETDSQVSPVPIPQYSERQNDVTCDSGKQYFTLRNVFQYNDQSFFNDSQILASKLTESSFHSDSVILPTFQVCSLDPFDMYSSTVYQRIFGCTSKPSCILDFNQY